MRYVLLCFILAACSRPAEDLQVNVVAKGEDYHILIKTDRSSAEDRKFWVTWSVGNSQNWAARYLVVLPAGSRELDYYEPGALMFEKNVNWVKFREVPLSFDYGDLAKDRGF